MDLAGVHRKKNMSTCPAAGQAVPGWRPGLGCSSGAGCVVGLSLLFLTSQALGGRAAGLDFTSASPSPSRHLPCRLLWGAPASRQPLRSPPARGAAVQPPPPRAPCPRPRARARPMGVGAGAAAPPLDGLPPRGRRATRQCAESSSVMATVREKAAALSLSAVCSPAARPTGTGQGEGRQRLIGAGGGGKQGALSPGSVGAAGEVRWGEVGRDGTGLTRWGLGGLELSAWPRSAESSVQAPFPAPQRFKSWPLSAAGGGRCFRPGGPVRASRLSRRRRLPLTSPSSAAAVAPRPGLGPGGWGGDAVPVKCPWGGGG